MYEDLEKMSLHVPLDENQIKYIEDLARHRAGTLEFSSNAPRYILQLINTIRVMERHNRDMGYERSERD